MGDIARVLMRTTTSSMRDKLRSVDRRRRNNSATRDDKSPSHLQAMDFLTMNSRSVVSIGCKDGLRGETIDMEGEVGGVVDMDVVGVVSIMASGASSAALETCVGSITG